MLANVEPPRNDFHALARYLVHGSERPTNPNRVAWAFTRNLMTDDPLKAAAIMAATAERSRRCRHAAYHLSINWHPDERPSPEVMQEIATRTLDLAGLAEHQALVMGHGDKPHAHLHMMINRVHPETGKAWSTSHDYRRFDRIMKLLSEEHGFRYVPGHAFEPELTDELPTKPNSNATFAAKRGASTNRPQWSNADARAYGAALSDELDRASGWEDIETMLAEDGLTLEAKGKGSRSGLIVGNAHGYARFSRLGLTAGAQDLTARFGQSFTEYRAAKSQRFCRAIWSVDEIDIARAIGSKEQVRAAINRAVGERKARLAAGPWWRRLEEEIKEALKATTSLKPPMRRSRPATRVSTAKRKVAKPRSER